MTKTYFAIGLMSGTSMDGIDIAGLETDGETFLKPGPAGALVYSDEERAYLRQAVEAAASWKAGDPVPEAVASAEEKLTAAHVEAVRAFLNENDLNAADVDVIGFHGQTVLHAPDQGRTVQIGHGDQLAATLGIDVVNDFRTADVAAGGEGAPFAPLYHKALAENLNGPRPIAVLNLGGVANVTWLGDGPDDILAFDTGPASGALDDWVQSHGAGRMDVDGQLAKAGKVNEAILAAMLTHPFFDVTPPKSLDRLDFPMDPVAGLSLEDGAATLTAFTAACIERATEHLPASSLQWIVCGGGRYNPAILGELRGRLGVPVEPAESVGWRGDDVEAEAFAFLAVRSLRGLPLSVPGTTKVPKPQTGGVLHRAEKALA
ncbi:anhydro-N-acetylmuramic acid kinase [Parvibaculaceae bacterium PLY_AMNH_Bact1]|nr:anhydro-N-acetylmuramic acid kinase [Parvibaculaceae bacterium PLY_AMNH_Bact1]